MCLPLVYGLTLNQVADAIGVSIGWACQLRTRFIRNRGLSVPLRETAGDKQRRRRLSREEEVEFLAPFLEPTKTGGVVVVRDIKSGLEARLGRTVALATVYNLLHRHGWNNPGSRTDKLPSD